jgi:hypothetical protein
MRNCLLLLLFGFAIVCHAQSYDADSVLYTPIAKNGAKKIKLAEEEKDTKRIGYFFNVQMGSLIGCNNCGKGRDVTFSAATTHGVTVGKHLRGGLGVGLDSYANWQTLPVFVSVSWDLIGNKNRNAVFVQLNYGWAHPWFVRSNLYNNYTTDPYHAVSGGRMVNSSIGYRIKYHDLKLSFGIGYKVQRIFYRSDPSYVCLWCDFYHIPYENLDITQDINRLQLMMSVGWR